MLTEQWRAPTARRFFMVRAICARLHQNVPADTGLWWLTRHIAAAARQAGQRAAADATAMPSDVAQDVETVLALLAATTATAALGNRLTLQAAAIALHPARLELHAAGHDHAPGASSCRP